MIKALLEKNRIAWVISGILVIVILLMRQCSGAGNNGKVRRITTTTVEFMKFTKSFPVYTPKLVNVYLPSESTIDSFPYGDSTFCKELLISHLSQKLYHDTIGKKDDSLQVDIAMWVSKNNVDSVRPRVMVNIPYVKTAIQIDTIQKKTPWKLYVRGSFGFNPTGIVGGPELVLTDRKFMMYSAGVDFSTFTGPVYRIGVGVKLSIKKK